MSAAATGLYEIFSGLNRAYGCYIPEATASGPKGKVGGSATTVREAPTPELFDKHLDGAQGIGIVPIRDDSTCVWGAIDVDTYPLDHEALVAKIRAMQLPLFVGRSKSGGAHLFLFLREPGAPAKLIQEKLMSWAVALGHRGVEIFPKQTSLDGKNDVGNWLNLPYFGGDKTNRPIFHPQTGEMLTPREFINTVKKCRGTAEQLINIHPPEPVSDDEALRDGPPCLQTLAADGFPQGTRNNALFNIAIYLRKRWPDEWRPFVDQYNQKYLSPPLGHQEIATITKSVGRKSYSYRCKDQPICAACSRSICVTRPFGIGEATDDPMVALGDLIKLETDPITWIWDVNGHKLKLSTDELLDIGRFRRRCVEVTNRLPRPIKAGAWQKILEEKLTSVNVQAVPADATLEGQVMEWFARFATGRATARAVDELLLGKPFTVNGEMPIDAPKGMLLGRVYFRVTDFLTYLKNQKVNGVSEKTLYVWLRERDAKHHFWSIKGKGCNIWSMPAIQGQTESSSVPRSEYSGL